MLVKAIKSVNKGDSEFRTMIDMYKNQDIESMAQSIKSDESGSDLSYFENILLTKRNISWIPLIAKMSALKPTLYAVGAGHLGGEKGVINLLRKEGFTVRPLK